MVNATLPEDDEKTRPDTNESDATFRDTFNVDQGLKDAENHANNGAIDQNKDLGELEDKPQWADKVEGGGAKSGKFKFIFNRANTKKYGPITAIILSIALGGVGIASISPAFVVGQVVNSFFTQQKSDPALSFRKQLVLKVKMDNIKNGFATMDADGKCGIKCKFGTVSDSMIKKLEKNGFHVDTDDTKIPGRSVINSLRFPDTVDGSGKSIKGVTATTGDEFAAAIKDTVNSSALNKVINNSRFLMNGKVADFLRSRGLSKASQTSGDTESQVADSERENLGLPEEDPDGTVPDESSSDDPNAKLGTKGGAVFEGKINDVTEKISGKTMDIAALVCTTYSVSKYVVLADKAAKIAVYSTLVWTFINGWNQLQAGDGSSALASFLGDQATTTDNNKKLPDGSSNPFYGQSLTDSNGYKMAAYNDTPGTLSSNELKYSITALGFIGVLNQISSLLSGKSGSAQAKALNDVCSPGATILTTAAFCATQEATDTLLGTIVPIIGNIFGAAAGLVACGAENGAAFLLGSAVIPKILPPLAKQVIKADAPQIEGIVGGALGDAMYSGSASIFGGVDSGYGMAAATSASQVASYAIDTAPIQKQEADIAMYDAQKTPFDINNQYSFIGMLAKNVHLASFANSSVVSSIGNVASLIPLGFGSLFSNSFAASTTDAASVSNLYNNSGCTDPGLTDIGVVADAFCNPTYVMDDTTLNMPVETALNYMLDNGQIDEDSGLALPKTDYANYVQYCVNRSEPLGEGGILGDVGFIGEKDTYLWEEGANCQAGSAYSDTIKNELPYFQAYTMDYSINGTMESDDTSDQSSAMSILGEGDTTSDDTSTPTSTTPTTSVDASTMYQDSTDVACAPGTTDAGTTSTSDSNGMSYYNGVPVAIHLCSLPNTNNIDPTSGGYNQPAKVNARVSGQWLSLINQMRADLNETIVTVNDSYRTYAEQTSLYNAYTSGNGNLADRPGYSNHEMGLAIDFSDSNGATISDNGSDSIYNWLSSHAATYGFNRISSEPWHWEPIGAN